MTKFKKLIVLGCLLGTLGATGSLALAAEDDGRHAPTLARITLHVEGMVGTGCPVLLEAALRRQPGVRSVDARLARQDAVVEYDARLTSVEAIRAAIKDKAGFDTLDVELQ